VTQVACGWRHTVVITMAGNVYSWGRGTSGQLGHGDIRDRSMPKRLELLSFDGLACQQIESSRSTNSPASHWVSPSERYAVVPDETLSILANRLNQNASVQGPPESREVTSMQVDASVPDTSS